MRIGIPVVRTSQLLKSAKGSSRLRHKYTWRELVNGEWVYHYPGEGGSQQTAAQNSLLNIPQDPEPEPAPASTLTAADRADVARLQAKLDKILPRIERLDAVIHKPDPMSEHWRFGKPGGSGDRKNITRLNNRRSADLDRTIDAAVEWQKLVDQRDRLQNQIASIASGKRAATKATNKTISNAARRDDAAVEREHKKRVKSFTPTLMPEPEGALVIQPGKGTMLDEGQRSVYAHRVMEAMYANGAWDHFRTMVRPYTQDITGYLKHEYTGDDLKAAYRALEAGRPVAFRPNLNNKPHWV